MPNFKFLNINKLTNFLKKHIAIVVILISVGAAGYLGYDYYKTQKELSEFKKDSDVLAIKEKNDLLKTLGKLVLLPEGEEPTIATVADAEKLRNQKFFGQAENGDKVVIYPQSQRAILYRPSLKKIIESAPVSISDLDAVNKATTTRNGSEVEESTPSNDVLGEQNEEEIVLEPASVAIYNGTLYVAGLANDVATFIEDELGEDAVSIDILSNAEEVYDETLIIDVTGKYPEVVGALNSLLRGTIEEKPQDVEFPDVDIVVIAGKDILDNEDISF